MLSDNIEKDQAYGTTAYNISTAEKIPYQLTFERDLYVNRVNVALLPMIMPEGRYCTDLRKSVCECFEDYLKNTPNETLYFETEIQSKEGYLRMMKFIRWMSLYKDVYNFHFEATNSNDLKYMEVYIKNL